MEETTFMKNKQFMKKKDFSTVSWHYKMLYNLVSDIKKKIAAPALYKTILLWYTNFYTLLYKKFNFSNVSLLHAILLERLTGRNLE